MRYLLGEFDLSPWPKLSVLLFTLIFAFVCVSVFRPSQRARFERASKLPLSNGTDGNNE